MSNKSWLWLTWLRNPTSRTGFFKSKRAAFFNALKRGAGLILARAAAALT